MRKIFIVLSMLIVIILLYACKSNENNDLEITYGESEQFSDSEMKSAVEAIIDKFKGFDGCELIKIWYDESKANLEIERYLTRDSSMKKDNIIIFYSDFKVDSSGKNPVLNPDSTYTDWMWILTREDIDKEWIVQDWGY